MSHGEESLISTAIAERLHRRDEMRTIIFSVPPKKYLAVGASHENTLHVRPALPSRHFGGLGIPGETEPRSI